MPALAGAKAGRMVGAYGRLHFEFPSVLLRRQEPWPHAIPFAIQRSCLRRSTSGKVNHAACSNGHSSAIAAAIEGRARSRVRYASSTGHSAISIPACSHQLSTLSR